MDGASRFGFLIIEESADLAAKTIGDNRGDVIACHGTVIVAAVGRPTEHLC
jgi:hypothetical protein